MKKQIIINNIKKYNDYKNSYDVSNNIKSLYNNVIKETKKTYIELINKGAKKDLSSNILELYDNYDKQLNCIVNIQNIESYQKQHILQALKKKLASYKQQDIKKGYHDNDDSADYADFHDYANFITLENIIEKLISCSMKCYYCNTNTYILFQNVREESQWTLDRLNNYDEHSNINTIICCLKCNLQRRRKNSTKFKFSKQMGVIKKIE